MAKQAPSNEPHQAGSTPPTDEHTHAAHDSHMASHGNSGIDSNVARWIEERDILLQTGVYSSSDPTIQKLDLKIRQALAQQAST